MSVALLGLVLLIALCGLSGELTGLPSYYVDPEVEAILVGNRLHCMQSHSQGARALHEVSYLKKISASEYFRSHELYAYHYFIELGAKNEQRRYNYSEAELEYIPLLPMHWSTQTRKQTKCGYQSLITAVLEVQQYLEKRDTLYATSPTASLLPKFTVASTFNLRTEMGTGMPTQVRKGAAWESVMRFVTSLTVGHYERWPQCPDLLRKSPKLNVELPYVTTTAADEVVLGAVSDLGVSKGRAEEPKRMNMFFFSGNFELFGPEMVCSVRNAVMALADRADTVIVNSTMSDANGPLQPRRIAHYAARSVFCIVAKGDSYSTSFFYLAMRHGCLPVVVSDWFVFAFPWAVPYERFVLRVMEADFLLNPGFVLDYIKNNIVSAGQGQLLEHMRTVMREYAPLLSFDKVKAGSPYHLGLLRHDKYMRDQATTPTAAAIDTMRQVQPYTFLPLELLILEVRYAQQPHRYYNSVPCLRPYMCSDTHLPGRMYDAQATDYAFPAKSKARSVEVSFPSPAPLSGTPASVGSEVGYHVINDGYQVKGLFLPQYEDQRSHLCRHASRLIGSYKIVFFMQCVRILWPLQPGSFKPVDNTQRFLPGFDNKTQTIARYRGGRYPVDPEGLSEADMRFVSAFHNATKPAGWGPTHYPPLSSSARSKIIAFTHP